MTESRDGFWMRMIAIASVLIIGLVGFLFWGPRPEGLKGALDVSMLPAVNATFNGTAFVLLIAALVAVKKGSIAWHKKFMLAAFTASAGFLVSYVLYHTFQKAPKPYVGEYKGLYLGILIPHIILAAVVLPLQLMTLYRGWQGQIENHRTLAKVALPMWLYVSGTGVVIFWMLYR